MFVSTSGGEGDREGAAGSPVFASMATPVGTVARKPAPGVLAKLFRVLRRETEEARSVSVGVASFLTLAALDLAFELEAEACCFFFTFGLMSLDTLLAGVSDCRAFLRTC